MTMANHLESGGLAGRVHISKTTAACLRDVYELEPADGHLRDGYIRQAGLETFFIKQTGPSGTQKLKPPSGRRTTAQRLPYLRNDDELGQAARTGTSCELAPNRDDQLPGDSSQNHGVKNRLSDGPKRAALGPSSSPLVNFQLKQTKRAKSCEEAALVNHLAQVSLETQARPVTPDANSATSNDGESRLPTTSSEAEAHSVDPDRLVRAQLQSKQPIPAPLPPPVVEVNAWGGGFDDLEDEEYAEDEENGEDWRPEIPFMNLNRNRGSNVDSMSSKQSFKQSSQDQEGNEGGQTNKLLLEMGKFGSQDRANESSLLTVPNMAAHQCSSQTLLSTTASNVNTPLGTSGPEVGVTSRSMSSLLRNSFRRRDRSLSGGRPKLAPSTQSVKQERANEQQMIGRNRANKNDRLDAIRRTYYRSFNIKSRDKNREKLQTTGSSFSQGIGPPWTASRGQTPGTARGTVSVHQTVSRRRDFKDEDRCRAIEQAGDERDDGEARAKHSDVVPRLTQKENTRQIGEQICKDNPRTDLRRPGGRRSSLVCIKIIHEEASGAANKQRATSERPEELKEQNLTSGDETQQNDSSLAISYPPSTRSSSIQLGSRLMDGQQSEDELQAISVSPCSQQKTSKRSSKRSHRSTPLGVRGYVVLFMRLFLNKLQRTGCCGINCFCCGPSQSSGQGGSSRYGAYTRANRRRLRRANRLTGGRQKKQSLKGNQIEAQQKIQTLPTNYDVQQQTGNEIGKGRQQRNSSSLDSSAISLGQNSSIEVEISRRMMKEHINWFRLTFKSAALEEAYCQIRYTTSKSNIVYIFISWLLMALVGLLSLPNIWHTVKIILIATVPLSAFACFYMSDSFLYNRYMMSKLKEAAAAATTVGPKSKGDISMDGKPPKMGACDSTNTSPSIVLEGGRSRRHGVGPLVHRVAKFWAKLDKIPAIWNFFIFSFNLIMILAFMQMNSFQCENMSQNILLNSRDHPNDTLSNTESAPADEVEKFSCIHQENMIFGSILIMIQMGSFVRSSYLRKVILLSTMTLVFSAFFLTLDDQLGDWISSTNLGSNLLNTIIYDGSTNRSKNASSISWKTYNIGHDHTFCPLLHFDYGAPNPASLKSLIEFNLVSPYSLISISQCDPNLVGKTCVIVLIIFIGLVYVCRSTERISRLDFLWKLQASKELQDMRALRHYNTQLLENILPDHVAAHFLQDERNSEELYAKSYPCVAVLFASIPNFSSFYSEDVNNGMECIRLLNEIIFDFDQLLELDKFKSIEKVKTISSTYLAACGLNPRDQGEPPEYHLSTCANFAFAMKQALNEVNVHSFNSFVMRIGISHGPLVGGVIGAKKPVFDIWGDTVNEASRMDSTGTLDMIQVPKRSAVILASEGFLVQCRGVIQVKGKGEMETYYVLEKSSPERKTGPAQDICNMLQAQTGKEESQTETSSKATTRAETEQSESSVASPQEGDDKSGKETEASKTSEKQVNIEAAAARRKEIFRKLVEPTPMSPASAQLDLRQRRFNRYARTAQSLKEPRHRHQRSGKLIIRRPGDLLELGELSALSGPTGVLPAFNSHGNSRASWRASPKPSNPLLPLDPSVIAPGSSVRAKYQFDLGTGSADHQQLEGLLPPTVAAGLGPSGSETTENSLTAVVYNMVQMRRSYEPLAVGRLNQSATGSQTQVSSSSGKQDTDRDNHHHSSSLKIRGLYNQ